MDLAQLQVFSCYSLLSSTNRISELVSTAKDLGYQALAITDLNNMSGVLEFAQACQNQEIKPIYGLTIEFASLRSIDEKSYRLILLATSLEGYRDLMKISTLKMETPLSEADSFTLLTMKPFLKDVIAITPGKEGELENLVREGNYEEAVSVLKTYRTFFQENNLYAGLDLSFPQKEVDEWANFSKKLEIPSVALHDVRYLKKEDDFSLRILQHIQTGTKISFEEYEQTGPYFLPAAREFAASFTNSGYEKALKQVDEIIQLCSADIPIHQHLLPHYPVPDQETAESYLKKLCEEYFPKRVHDRTEEYQQRLTMELEVIHKMGFDDYFLIVWDVMNFAHENEIVTGAGRGSAAGSLVSYVLSITDVDPIRYNLLFERFLNEERNTMPDIDLDLPDNRREEVLQYVHQKYGHHHMAQIATFGTMAAKMALRDVARVFGLSQNEANEWSKAVPNTLKITLKQSYQESDKLRKLVGRSSKNGLLFETAQKIEGLPRHVSTHAAGIVLSDVDLTDYVPLQRGSNEISLTQFTMGDVEKIGLLKIDFLGLRNLSIMDSTLRNIKRLDRQSIQLNQIPLDDEATLKLFKAGSTTGIFQFESSGIRNVLRRLQPDSIEDIASVNALYRPGPMENIDLFIKRKNGLAVIDYLDECLRPILEVTYGIMVYQEQVMQVASKMAGFTLGQADILRRAMSKKKKDVIDRERIHFVQGSLAQGFSEEKANEVYDYIERFANYGFNRSHAVAYSFIGYQMAYLKVHYPAPFFAALLHSVRHNAAKVKEYAAEAKKFQLSILSPSINQSEYSFFVDKKRILFGFSSLKGIRREFIQNILLKRKEGGKYLSLEDFLFRIDHKWLKEESILPLILVGAFDELQANRKLLVTELPGMIKNIQYSAGSLDLLEQMTLKKVEVEDYSLDEKLEYENDLIGTSLSGHPVEGFSSLKKRQNITEIIELEKDQKANILFYLKKIRTIRTKKGETMAFFEGNDATGDLSVTVFPVLYRKIVRDLKEKTVYYMEGKAERSKYNQELQFLAQKIVPAKEMVRALSQKTCYIRIVAQNEEKSFLNKLHQLLAANNGGTPVILYYEKSDKKIALNAENWIKDSFELKNQLSSLLGEENVIFR